MTAREDVLARIRAANAAAFAAGATPPAPIPREYHPTGTGAPGSAAVLDLFRDRLVDYRATVLDCTGTESDTDASIAATIAQALTGIDGPVVVAPGLPSDWWPTAVVDTGFTAAQLDGFAAVISTCAAACAVTGTIVLDGEPGQGRRALTLVPDVHVCVVRAEQVVETVPELLGRLTPTRPLTFVSGPSATSDIELERVEGVHGPRTLVVVLVA